MIIFPTSGNRPGLVDDKFFGKAMAESILDAIDRYPVKMVKIASAGSEAVVTLLEALGKMNLRVNLDIGELIRKVKAVDTGEDKINKYASGNDGEKEERIIIASKEIKDSHYQIDIAKDVVTKGDKKLHMVSLYMRDAYLGRYLIKRNYYFMGDNSKDASELFDDMVKRSKAIRRRYYDDKIPVNSVFAEVRAYTDGLRGDVEHHEDKS